MNGKAKTKKKLVPAPGAAFVEASALAGLASGVALGAIAGPPGAIIGGALGAAVGLAAGSTVEAATRKADAHDRALDDAIGVTSGDLGAGAVQKLADTSAAAELLRAEHARLEIIYDRLLDAYHVGDWLCVQAEWNVFEPALRAHMDLEEKRVFPLFREIDVEEHDDLAAEHQRLRERLDILGVLVELHAVPPTDAEELIEQLRAHRAREERVLYPWIDAAFAAPISHEGT